MTGTMPLVVAIAQPFWGVVADRMFGKKAVYTGTRVIFTIVLLTLALPAISSSYERTLTVSLGMSLFSSGGVLDAYALQVCGTHSRHLYGRLRMWTAVLPPSFAGVPAVPVSIMPCLHPHTIFAILRAFSAAQDTLLSVPCLSLESRLS